MKPQQNCKTLYATVILIVSISMTLLAGCSSNSVVPSYDAAVSTLSDVHIAEGTAFTAPTEGVFVRWERYVWLLKCENEAK